MGRVRSPSWDGPGLRARCQVCLRESVGPGQLPQCSPHALQEPQMAQPNSLCRNMCPTLLSPILGSASGLRAGGHHVLLDSPHGHLLA